LLLRLLVLCLFSWFEFVPASASAMPAIPMCSIFGECIEAPPPGSAPTGGEIRAAYPNPLERATVLERAPQKDSPPLPFETSPSDPARISSLDDRVINAPLVELSKPRAVNDVAYRERGALREVFRPPCQAA